MELIDREKLKSTIARMVELPNETRAQVLGAISRAKAVTDTAKLERQKERIAYLESQLVKMRYHDDNITLRRVFEVEFSDLLEPVEAMDIFVRNVQRIFERKVEDG